MRNVIKKIFSFQIVFEDVCDIDVELYVRIYL